MKNLPEYSAITGVLSHTPAPPSAAQIHGLLCGVLTAKAPEALELWLTEACPEDSVPANALKHCRAVLSTLYQVTSEQIQDEALGFHLLLPDDRRSLSDRTEALGKWCRGFLSGLGLVDASHQISTANGHMRALFKHEDVQDALNSLSALANVPTTLDAPTEEDEKDFAELIEFVRMAVLMIYSVSHEEGTTSLDEMPVEGNSQLH